MKKLIVAIDGPAGSGKSTTAKMVAKKLGLLYLDTGAMYRAITLKAMRLGYDPTYGERITEMARKTELRFEIVDGKQRIFLDGEDVTLAIRQTDVTSAVSPVSAHPQLREILVQRQREIGDDRGIVAEGRDTASVVYPNADVKVYLTASIEERAARRVKELEELHIDSTYEEELKSIKQRDDFDSSREASPLKKTDGSVEIDTSNLTIQQQADEVIKLAEASLRRVEN